MRSVFQARKRAAATLKKTKALHEAQLVELRGEVEAAVKVCTLFPLMQASVCVV